jgi:hypothetical protein
VACPPPIDQKEDEESEVPVSETYHSSETREHEFADDLELCCYIRREGGYKLSGDGTMLRKQTHSRWEGE